MKSVLVGAVGSTAIALKAMQEAGHPPAILVTFDAELGRRRHSDYYELAPMAGPETQVLFVDNVNAPDVVAKIAAAEPDLLFVIGWSQLVGPEVRALARRYTVGFHPTPLPAFRGRAAMGWTILLGLDQGGATLFVIDEGVDSGPILAQQLFPLDPRETVVTLGDKHMAALGDMLRDLLPRLADGSAVARPQPTEGVSYCARRTPLDSLIDWSRPAAEIDRLVRASTRPYPGAYTFTRKRKLFIWATEPVGEPETWFAAAGQVVDYRGGNPVVRCGDGSLLMITDCTDAAAAPARLTGQVRLFDRPPYESAEETA
jgi:methionyl-tRNA formyltransferase